ncbi:MAG: hypothetical protein O2930_01735 [Acidobacteria bacterium]|nr:hypothetical protein [Acidobacteriota bacterium]
MPDVTSPHLHLLMNHLPVIGTMVGLGLLLLAFLRRSDDLLRASLELFFLIALASLPVYVTGLAAQEALLGRPDVSATAIAAHHNGALVAFAFVEITGAIAWLALWQRRRLTRPAGWTSPTIVVLAIVTLVLMAGAASAGGEIRHPEINVNPTDAARAGWITAAAVQDFVISSPWVWPTAEVLHFIGLSLLVGVLLVVNLRVMGGLQAASFASLHRLLPWAVLGFGVNLVTGTLFLIAMPEQFVTSGPFLWKMAFLMIAGAELLYLTVFDRLWAIGAGMDAAGLDKAITASAVCAWLGVIYCGRMLPFIAGGY